MIWHTGNTAACSLLSRYFVMCGHSAHHTTLRTPLYTLPTAVPCLPFHSIAQCRGLEGRGVAKCSQPMPGVTDASPPVVWVKPPLVVVMVWWAIWGDLLSQLMAWDDVPFGCWQFTLSLLSLHPLMRLDTPAILFVAICRPKYCIAERKLRCLMRAMRLPFLFSY